VGVNDSSTFARHNPIGAQVSACAPIVLYIHSEGQAKIYEWDEAKRRSNLFKHAIDFEEVRSFHWDSTMIHEDGRRDYGEQRWKALGRIDCWLIVVIVYTDRDGATRSIGARLASNPERRATQSGEQPRAASNPERRATQSGEQQGKGIL
jgi:uncharacterized DUF497 family protein